MNKVIYFFSMFLCAQIAFSDDNALSSESKAKGTNTNTSPVTKNTLAPQSTPEEIIIYYVLANNGLNYRERPNGKILGQFPLMTKVNIIERTGISHIVKENGNYLEGEWVAVKDKNKKNVYVFDGFLLAKKKLLIQSNQGTLQKGKSIFHEYSFFAFNSNGKEQVAFLTLSENYPWNSPGRIINDDYLTLKTKNKNYILDNKNRAIFNFKIGIEDSDIVYLYNPEQDKVLSFNVKELPLLAEKNPYGGHTDESDFLVGFDFNNVIKEKDFLKGYHSFGYIGQKNPFVTGDIKPIIWEETDKQSFPVITPSTEVLNHPDYFKAKDLVEFYRFRHNEYSYFLKIKKKENMYEQAFRLIVTVKSGQDNSANTSVNSSEHHIIYDHFYHSSEGATPRPLSFKDNKNNQLNQWTGKVFKDESPILLGFMDYSFSCPIITLLNPSEKIIPIFCDSRH